MRVEWSGVKWSEVEWERVEYLVVMVPVDEVWWLWAVLHQTGQVDGGACVDVHVRSTQDVRERLCVWRGERGKV